MIITRLHVYVCSCVVAVLLACAPAFSFAAEAEAEAPVVNETPAKELSAKEAAALIKNPPAEGLIIVDVRTPQEFAAGHIEGAKNMDYFGPQLERQLLQLNRQAPTLIYCNSGNRSAGALDIVRQMGFTKVYHLTKGIEEWKAEDRPLVQSKK